MALARSASGPGGLSINTTSANSLFGTSTAPAAGGMFGSTQASMPTTGGIFGSSTTNAPNLFGSNTAAAPAPGGLFGSSTTANPQQSSSLLGGSQTQQQTGQQTGGMFGGPQPAQQQQQTGALFGQSQPAPQQQSGAQPGGLFGSSTSAPAQGQRQTVGGLFGQSQPAQQQQSGAQPGGLFGSSTSAPAQGQQQASGGLFSGLSGNQQTQNQNTGGGGLFGGSSTIPGAGNGGLFGGLNNQQQNQTQSQPATSLFGGGLGNIQTQQPQPQQSSMFSQGQQGGGFCGSTFGGSKLGGGLSLGQSNQQQQSAPGVRIDMTNIRGTTRFSDLHEDLQKQINQIDSVIQLQIQLKNDCDAIMPSHSSQLSQVPNDVEFCRRKLIGVENGQDSDVQSIAIASQMVKNDAEHAKLCFKAIDNLKLPSQYHNSGIWSAKSTSNDSQSQNGGEAQDIVSFFSKTANDLAATLQRNEAYTTEIEQHLRGVEAASGQQINALVAKRNGASRQHSDPVEDLTAVLREFEQSLLGVAGRVGGAREAVQSVQLDGFGALANGRASVNGRRSGVY